MGGSNPAAGPNRVAPAGRTARCGRSRSVGTDGLGRAARVRVGNVIYLGNHGMERGYLPRGARPEKWSVSVIGASEVEAALASALPRGRDAISQPWLIVERKPPTVAFHYRQAPDVAAAAAAQFERPSTSSIGRSPGAISRPAHPRASAAGRDRQGRGV